MKNEEFDEYMEWDRQELVELIASLKEFVVQATPYVEYAVKYSTPLSQKLSEEWLEKTQARREK